MTFNFLETSKASMYDEHVRKLYEEMEAQMKAENARVVALVAIDSC